MAEGNGHPMFEQSGPKVNPEEAKKIDWHTKISTLKSIGEKCGFKPGWLAARAFKGFEISTVGELYTRCQVVKFEDEHGTRRRLEVTSGTNAPGVVNRVSDKTIDLINSLLTHVDGFSRLREDLGRVRTPDDYRR